LQHGRTAASQRNDSAGAFALSFANPDKPKRMKTVAAKGTRQSAIVHKGSAARRKTDLLPMIDDLRAKGLSSLRQIADGLNDAGLTTARGQKWTATQVMRLAG
jgi:hypothetical protein